MPYAHPINSDTSYAIDRGSTVELAVEKYDKGFIRKKITYEYENKTGMVRCELFLLSDGAWSANLKTVAYGRRYWRSISFKHAPTQRTIGYHCRAFLEHAQAQ